MGRAVTRLIEMSARTRNVLSGARTTPFGVVSLITTPARVGHRAADLPAIASSKMRLNDWH